MALRSAYINNRSRSNSAAGFTLLEVMIAIAIISIALISLQALNIRTIAIHERLQRITQATLLAQHKLSEVESLADGIALQDEDQGVFEEPFEQYKWQTSFTDTPLDSVRMVTVDVTWGDGEKNESVSIDSFIF
ncbi:general secretion pathway protein I [Desulfuromusa kysingii]|uniref:General secretion pathway protein I n=1 Tax=Desulfuromusa kysingii TaxID=37625 RepID=A0A1H4CRS3_9BACT|nr:prepilin-type N-terminal cleavage/methylation domain-containing protein [Desulfuromusa kysingii]SEA63008.1 general secretion pathway protein I [Desulfuromusa kysingii]